MVSRQLTIGLILAASMGATVLWYNLQMESSYQKGYSLAELQTSQKYEKALATSQGVADAKAKQLKQASDEAYNELKRHNHALSNRVSSLSLSLRQRPSREDSGSACVHAGSPTPTTITGASLPREDAEFLAREAALAEVVQKERDYYYGTLQRIYEASSGNAGRQDGETPHTKPVLGAGLSP